MCQHYKINDFGKDGDCRNCLMEKKERYEAAFKKILNRTWELGDYLPHEVLEDIMRIVNTALKGPPG